MVKSPWEQGLVCVQSHQLHSGPGWWNLTGREMVSPPRRQSSGDLASQFVSTASAGPGGELWGAGEYRWSVERGSQPGPEAAGKEPAASQFRYSDCGSGEQNDVLNRS